MNEFDHVQIKLDEFGKGSVMVNGHPLKSSLGVSVEATGGEPTVVTIRLLATADVDVLVKAVKDRVVRPVAIGEDSNLFADSFLRRKQWGEGERERCPLA